MKQLVLDLIPPAQPTLANFVCGRNAEAIAALRIFMSAEQMATKVLYVWGGAGCGKSHLIQACRNTGLADARSVLAGSEFDGSRQVLDDVQHLDTEAQQALFNLINQQLMGPGSLFVAGNVAPRDLPLRRDLSSRLGSGLVFQLHPLLEDEAKAALHAHARSRGFELREDVATYLLRHSRRDMSSLIGVLNEMDSYSIETGREITLPLLKQAIQPSLV